MKSVPTNRTLLGLRWVAPVWGVGIPRGATSPRGPTVNHKYQPNLQLAPGTLSFTVCFAAWGLISAFALRFREAFHLTATQTAFLNIAVPGFGGRAVFCSDDDCRRRAGLYRVLFAPSISP
jgi:hypothetical protein